jgi:AcrR family transcriptional regulator
VPRPRSLDHATIAAAALAVLDRDGLGGLSMRAVAAELGMGTMSLYRYVTDREQLERLLLDRVLSAVDTSVPARTGWQRRIVVLADRVRLAVGEHPHLVPLLLAHRQAAVVSLDWGEAVAAALTEGGVTGRRRVVALRAVISYVLGALQAQHYGPLAGPGTDVLAALPDHPMLAETARQAGRVGPAEEFRGGLDLLLRGLH